MKKMLTLSLLTGLLVSLSFTQFITGTKSVSSIFSYSSAKANSDADAITETTINPTGSYFVIDNVAVDVGIEMVSTKMGSTDGDKSTSIGFGGAYYYPLETGTVYGGGALLITSVTPADADDAVKSNFIQIKAGYLYGLTENWYFDIGLKYNMGMGKVKSGSTEIGDNEVTGMNFGVGIATFF